MGKSTTAGFFAAAGAPVWDADAAVHRLYSRGGAAVAPLAAAFPQAVTDGAVDRSVLGGIVRASPAALARLEQIVHPLVRTDRDGFVAQATADLIVLDIPLLFETGGEAAVDATLLVTAPAALQRARVLARPGMTAAMFDAILARQMPDAEKRARANHIIETLEPEPVRAAVGALIRYIRSLQTDA
jgi:dephospho-CoA kinase